MKAPRHYLSDAKLQHAACTPAQFPRIPKSAGAYAFDCIGQGYWVKITDVTRSSVCRCLGVNPKRRPAMFLVAISVIFAFFAWRPRMYLTNSCATKCQYRTWHPRRAGAGAVAACGLETRALF